MVHEEHLHSTDTVPGRDVSESLGLVTGSSVRAKNIVQDIGAGLKGLVGGRIGSYDKLLAASRKEAIDQMKAAATDAGADAVVAVRFASSDIADGVSELFVWGTAVKLAGEPEDLG